jgi:hypothetical protein
MVIAVAEFIPYIAFLGAAVLIGWLVVDIGLKQVRKKGLAPMLARLSFRGLASKPQPLSEPEVKPLARTEPVSTSPKIIIDDTSISTEDDISVPTSLAGVFDPDLEPAEPVTPKAESAPEPAAEGNTEDLKEAKTTKTEKASLTTEGTETSDESAEAGDPSDDDVVYTDVLSVRRDSSVRVYDTSVAASERKAAAS